jgi:peptidyl-prolyl cis-trans isomerase D
MFAFLRKLIVPIMATVLVFFLATIVFEWGMNISSTSRASQDTIGIINGEEISVKIFERYYSSIMRQEQDKTDEDLSPAKLDEIKNQAWNQLVGDVLINQEISKHKIFVSDEEIYGYLRMYPPSELQNSPQFMTDGKFDYQKYIGAMANPQYAQFWASVENYVLPQLKKYKLQEQIIGTVRVSPAEVMDAFMDDRDSIKIGVLNITNSKIISSLAAPTKDEIKAYYEAHKEDFKIGKRATLAITLFSKEPSENDWERIRYQIGEIYDSAKAGADFAELAQTYSEDNTAEKGGDLGWFPSGRMVPEFDSAVATLQIGEISKPVKTRFGYHIIKLLGKRIDKETPPGGKEPTDVQKFNAAHILLKVSASQETLDQLALNAKDFSEAAKKEGFEKAAKDFNYEIKTTRPFLQAEGIQFLGRNQEAAKFAFDNEVGAISDVMENNSAYFVLKVASHLPEGYQTLEEAERSIYGLINTEKGKEQAFEIAKKAYESIKSGTPIAKAGEPYGMTYTETEMITRKGTIPGIGRSAELLGAAFALKNIGEVSAPTKHSAGSAIVILLAKNAANIDDFAAVKDSLQTVVLQKKQQEAYAQWFDNLASNSKIESFVDKFYGGGE